MEVIRKYFCARTKGTTFGVVGLASSLGMELPYCQPGFDATPCLQSGGASGSGVNHEASADGRRGTCPRSRPMSVTSGGALFRMSDPTASMLARVVPGRPIINNFLPECRCGHSSFDILMGGHT
jgi:hypothetical protein